ncbi:hypothetical protein HAX54_018112, partial [Datura stramonium]|nr:hypothetical protein [Datura stramonium]
GCRKTMRENRGKLGDCYGTPEIMVVRRFGCFPVEGGAVRWNFVGVMVGGGLWVFGGWDGEKMTKVRGEDEE